MTKDTFSILLSEQIKSRGAELAKIACHRKSRIFWIAD
jgi:hypothetical protein